MIVGWFFGIITFLFGLLLVFRSPIAGLIVLFLGVLMCYGGSRSGRQTTLIGSGDASNIQGRMSNVQREEEERRQAENRRRAQQQWWYWNTYLNPNNPNSPNSFMKRFRK
jgi:hypothetical protein